MRRQEDVQDTWNPGASQEINPKTYNAHEDENPYTTFHIMPFKKLDF